MTGHKTYCCRSQGGLSTGRGLDLTEGMNSGLQWSWGKSSAMWWWTGEVATTPSFGALPVLGAILAQKWRKSRREAVFAPKGDLRQAQVQPRAQPGPQPRRPPACPAGVALYHPLGPELGGAAT